MLLYFLYICSFPQQCKYFVMNHLKLSSSSEFSSISSGFFFQNKMFWTFWVQVVMSIKGTNYQSMSIRCLYEMPKGYPLPFVIQLGLDHHFYCLLISTLSWWMNPHHFKHFSIVVLSSSFQELLIQFMASHAYSCLSKSGLFKVVSVFISMMTLCNWPQRYLNFKSCTILWCIGCDLDVPVSMGL